MRYGNGEGYKGNERGPHIHILLLSLCICLQVLFCEYDLYTTNLEICLTNVSLIMRKEMQSQDMLPRTRYITLY